MRRLMMVTMVVAGLVLVGSGWPGSATAQVLNDLQPGSFLVFPKFDVRDGTTTQLRITNTSSTSNVWVRINFVCPGIKQEGGFCPAFDIHRFLTPHATTVINVGGFDATFCQEGFAVVIAENRAGGEPIAFDWLIGSYHIVSANEQVAAEAAQAIAIQSVREQGTVLGTLGGLQFGPDPDPASQDYVALGTQLFTDFRAVGPLDDNGAGFVVSELILLTLDVIAGAQNPATLVFVDFWNALEVPFSASWEYVCWTRVRLHELSFGFLESSLGTTHGSLTLTPAGNCPLPGACPPFEHFQPAILGAIDESVLVDGPDSVPLFSTKRNLYHDNVPNSTVYFPR